MTPFYGQGHRGTEKRNNLPTATAKYMHENRWVTRTN